MKERRQEKGKVRGSASVAACAVDAMTSLLI